MQYKSFCIVGGGSSGWMAAATMQKAFPNAEVTLIQPKGRDIIGVGESTLGHINRFFRFLGIKDKEWMPYCNATYKSSIAFKNFRENNGERFQYPFGRIDHNDYRSDYMTFFELQVKYPHLYPPEEFARFFNPNTILSEQNKLSPQYISEEMRNWNMEQDTAYHMDSEKFGEFLRKKFKKVKVYEGIVGSCSKDATGHITSVNITEGWDEGLMIEADLYIDCTGFKSLILEGMMGSKFISFNDVLFNDMAMTARVEYTDRKNQMDNYTDCVAMSNGWCYNIPLWNRVGAGYVFSKKYIDPDIAHEEFVSYLAKRYSPKVADNADYRLISIRHGKREKAWVKNVVGIGLAYGFLEPLESTGLMTTHENAIFLSDLLSQRNGIITEHSRSVYNFSAQKTYESMKIFISMHYSLSAREDNDYWSDCTNTIQYPGVRGTMLHGNFASMDALTDYYALLDGLQNRFYSQKRLDGLIYIGAGQDISPISKAMYDEKNTVTPEKKEYIRDIHKEYQLIKKQTIEWVKKQPSHYQYLKDNIHV